MGLSDRRVPWWDEDEFAAHDTLTELVDRLRADESLRLEKLRTWDEIYRGGTLVTSTEFALRRGDEVFDPQRLAGLTRNATDFLHSKVTAQVPGVRAVGTGATWNGLKTRRMTHFIEGATRAADVETEVPRAVLQGLIAGTSGVKCAVVDGRPHVETVDASELFFDPDDARHGRPRCMYQVRPVGRSELCARFAYDEDGVQDMGIESLIRSAPDADDSHGQLTDERWSWQSEHDSVDVYEAWLLPSGDDDTGRHVLCVHGLTLVDEDWDCPRFPIALFTTADPRPGHGIWGQGLVERLAPIQDQIDSLASQIDESIRHARLKVFVQREADIVSEHLEDPTIGTIIQTNTVNPPAFVTPEPVSAQVIDYLWRLVDQLYAMVGMNEAAAQGMKPGGLNSGKALQAFHDYGTLRHVDLAKKASRLTVDVVERLIDACRMAFSDTEGRDSLSVRYGTGSSIRQVRWDEVDMDRDEFTVELLPVSPIPTTFSGMVQQVEDALAKGLPPPAYAEQLLSDPDIAKVARIAMADADYVDDVVLRLLDSESEMPLVLDAMNKELAFDICRVELLNQVREGAPPEVVVRFEEYMADLAEAMAPPPPNEPLPGMGLPVPGGPVLPEAPGASEGLPVPGPMPPTQ